MKPTLILSLLILVSPLLAAQETGRLFHTPAERTQLDAEKYRYGQPAGQGSHYQGVVRRSQGPATLWVNGVPQEGPAPADLQVGPAPSAREASGDELLRGGRITVHPPRAAPRP